MSYRALADVLHRKPISLPDTATVQQACDEMRNHRVGAILVVDPAERLIGIFTGRDVVRLIADGHNPAHTKLERVMTRNPESMPPGRHAIEALRLKQDGGFRHLPVVEHGRVVGIVSVGDFRSHEHARLDEETGFWERI